MGPKYFHPHTGTDLYRNAAAGFQDGEIHQIYLFSGSHGYDFVAAADFPGISGHRPNIYSKESERDV
jgi:hypothetical protein